MRAAFSGILWYYPICQAMRRSCGGAFSCRRTGAGVVIRRRRTVGALALVVAFVSLAFAGVVIGMLVPGDGGWPEAMVRSS